MELVPLLEKKTEQRDEAMYETKRALVRYISSKLMLLQHAEPMVPDVWREIYTKMTDLIFEGDKEFEESFYSKPAIEAFQLYRSIKKTVGNKLIAPLYKMKQKKRDDILSKIASWHADYINPVISIEEQQKIHAFDDNVQQYFSGKELRVVSADEYSKYQCTFMVVGAWNTLGCGAGALISLFSCCLGGTKCACAPSILGLSLGIPIGCTLISVAGLSWYVIPVYCDSSNKVTL
jgi:hypothetical protein